MYREEKLPEPDFLSIKQFAAKVGVHPNTIRNAIRKGRLSALKMGSGSRALWRIAKTEIQRIAFLDMREYIEKVIKEEKEKEIKKDT
jgi:excisionase family DNA binding protein